MLNRFIKYIEQDNLFNSKDKILLAVSGGVDSMVMLYLFHVAGFKIGVAHANFNLRGVESIDDEMFVRDVCRNYNINFYSKSFDAVAKTKSEGISIQMVARELRYAWFYELLEKEKYQYVATAHHINDNIETVLMNWAKGGGFDQLSGIQLKNNVVIRPLLYFTRFEIQNYAIKKNIKWREDSSNDLVSYQRNFVRHKIVPPLKEINPNLEKAFMVSVEKMKGSTELMKVGLQKIKNEITVSKGTQLFIDKKLLLLQPNAVFVCFELLRSFGFGWDNCQQLVSALGGQSGKRFFSKTHQSVIDRKHIIVSPLTEFSKEVFIEEGQNKAIMGSQILKFSTVKTLNYSGDANEAFLDFDKIKFPLCWRKWQFGDYFFPLGMSHKKKISDFLIDKKLSLINKDSITVLMSNQKIVWVVGLRVDDNYKITSKTKRVLSVKVSSNDN